MKKLLLLMAGLATATGAMANWGTSIEDPVSVFPKGTNSYATEVRPGADGSAWAVIYHPNTKQADNDTNTACSILIRKVILNSPLKACW